MKKLITFVLTISLVSCLASCKDNDESSKTADSQAVKANVQQSTTTTTTTTASTTEKTTTTTTTTAKTTTETTTTTTAQTFDTTWYRFNEPYLAQTIGKGDLYAAPDTTSDVICSYEKGDVFEVYGYANDEWNVVYIDDQIAFISAFKAIQVDVIE